MMTALLTVWLIGGVLVMQYAAQREETRRRGMMRAFQAALTWPIWLPVYMIAGIVAAFRD